MKTCLNCQKEFEYKREAAKFCTVKCRVMYNRKNPKNAVTTVQMQALYNTMMEKLGKIEFAAPQTAYDAPKLPASFKEDEPLSFEKLKAQNDSGGLYHEFYSRLIAAQDADELQQVGAEISGSQIHWREKQALQNIGKQIYNQKFNF